jgi:WD40 repeat protein
MEKTTKSPNEETKYSFCHHIKSSFYNLFISKYDSDNSKNLFNLTKQLDKTKLTSEIVHNITTNYFLDNIGLDWVALYNSQSLSQNPSNKDGCIFTLAFDKYAEHLASSNHNHNIEIWDLKEKKIKKVITNHKEIVTGLEYFQSDPSYMMSCSLDKTIKLWKDYTPIHTFIEHSDWVRCIAVSQSSKYFLSGCVSSIIKLWDLEYRRVICSISNQNPEPDLLNTVNSLLFTNNNENIFLSGLRNGSVKLFDLRLHEKGDMLVKEFKAHKLKLNSVKLNHDDKYILTSGRDSLIRLWDFRKLPVGIYNCNL